MKKEKKAISAIVATVLLILITVAAVGLIWLGVVPWIQNIMNRGKAEQVCITATANLEINTERNLTYFYDSSKEVGVTVKRGGEEFDAAGIQIIIFGDGGSKTYTIEEGKSLQKVKVYGLAYGGNLSIPKANEEKTYMINITGDITLPTEVSIAPVVSVDSTKFTCEISDKATLTKG